MFNQIWTFIQDQLQTNSFLSGGAALMALGGLVAACRNLPNRLWRLLLRRVFLDFEILSKDEAFWWFDEWLSQQKYGQERARFLSVRTTHVKNDPDGPRSRASERRIILSPAPGLHWFFWRNRLVVVHRERKEDDGKDNGFTTVNRESFRVSIFTRDRQLIHELLEEARAIVTPPGEEHIVIFSPTKYTTDEWCSELKRKPRPLESVVLQGNLMESLIGDVQKFLDSEKWYIERGIPYRRGYMLYGPPGSGKSSTAFAVASHLKLNLAILNLNEPNFTDNDLRTLLATVPPGTIVLIEDIDCVFTKRTEGKDKENRVTFSGLLNAIDGVAASEGRILLMTTNYAELLDPALIRPGRCDVKVFIDNADYTQALKLFDRFFPDADAAMGHKFATEAVGNSMAALQGHLTKYCNDPLAAVINAADIHQSIRSSNEPTTQDAGTT